MDWEQLAQKKCPNCTSDLKNTGSSYRPFYNCESDNCTFKIGGTRFDEITKDMDKEKPVYRPRHFLSDNMMQPDYRITTVDSDSHDDDFFE